MFSKSTWLCSAWGWKQPRECPPGTWTKAVGGVQQRRRGQVRDGGRAGQGRCRPPGEGAWLRQGAWLLGLHVWAQRVAQVSKQS